MAMLMPRDSERDAIAGYGCCGNYWQLVVPHPFLQEVCDLLYIVGEHFGLVKATDLAVFIQSHAGLYRHPST